MVLIEKWVVGRHLAGGPHHTLQRRSAVQGQYSGYIGSHYFWCDIIFSLVGFHIGDALVM